MSYCRFAWDGSEVYVYVSSDGIECCGCLLGRNFTAKEPEEMISHLAEHRRAGHFVPEHAILGLWEDVPGSQRPSKPEPAALTRSKLMIEIAGMQKRLEELPAE